MNTIKTKAIVIKKMVYKEADLLVTLLTLDHGKIAALAKGVKKPKSRFVGNYELLSEIEVEIYEGKGFPIIKESKLITKINKDKSDNFFNLIHAISDITNHLIPDNEPHNEILKTLLLIINKIDTSNYSGNYILVIFIGFFIRQLGYGFVSPPYILDKNINADAIDFLHIDQHSLDMTPLKLEIEEVKILKLISNLNLKLLFGIKDIPDNKISNIKEILIYSLHQISNREIKSLKYL